MDDVTSIEKLSDNLQNIVHLIKNENTSETPVEDMNLCAKMKSTRRTRTVRVQHASIRRRTGKPLFTSGFRRMKAGRPAKDETTVRVHNNGRLLTDAPSANSIFFYLLVMWNIPAIMS